MFNWFKKRSKLSKEIIKEKKDMLKIEKKLINKILDRIKQQPKKIQHEKSRKKIIKLNIPKSDKINNAIKYEQNILTKVKAKAQKKIDPEIVKEFEELTLKQEQKLGTKAEELVKEKVERKNMFKDNVIKLLKSLRLLPKYVVKKLQKKL